MTVLQSAEKKTCRSVMLLDSGLMQRIATTLGPMADEVGIVVDVSKIDGVETLVVKFGDIGPLEAGVPAAEFEIATAA